ncbi:hypothetical protein PBCVCVR1_715R [Paramecium bursaria Chlorella virus CVR-1]|uniref:Uncharacterized protein n=1 Tax=Paramecium bursaria Chlorella virus CVA-1 TaxID=42683 RepID=M1HFM6_9PHYC|nr:hypothetical protein F8205_gp233 [Paramecium bursaria Chlorella virus CVA-1]AGE50592.1 hypothetical protein PBCVCVA1_708R [Paramecium bursaria Chlorella virus CVA-1]AGE52271.1 hypothetical protein PBCVCVR1_715R [Paramecium bursaria Chlorella virus CVR-1]
MAFRGEIIKMIENMVSSIEAHNFKITDTMKTHFVSFINEFFKHHVGTTDIDFKLTPNFLYAEAENIRVMIASDKNKKFEIPGYNIPMRSSIEGFILVDEMVCYDSVLMRCFAPQVPSSTAVNLPQYVDTPENQATPPVPVPTPAVPVPTPAAPSTAFVFNSTPASAPPTTPTPAPSFAPAPTPSFAPAPTPSFAPAPAPSFAPAPASTNIFAAKLTTPPPPTNIFNQTPATTSVATSPFAAFASPISSFSPKPMNTFSSFGKGTNIFARSDSTTSSS